jgi:hypothetical protein
VAVSQRDPVLIYLPKYSVCLIIPGTQELPRKPPRLPLISYLLSLTCGVVLLRHPAGYSGRDKPFTNLSAYSRLGLTLADDKVNYVYSFHISDGVLATVPSLPIYLLSPISKRNEKKKKVLIKTTDSEASFLFRPPVRPCALN